MAGNFLQLNEEKTEVLVCAPKKSVPSVMENLGPLATFAKPSIRNLGVTFDSALTWTLMLNLWSAPVFITRETLLS